MARRAVIFVPENPWPPRSGFHRRALSMIQGIRDAGFDPVVAGTTYHAGRPWAADSVDRLRTEAGLKVRLHRATLSDHQFAAAAVARGYRLRRRPLPLSSYVDAPPGLRRWFARLVDRVEPELILTSYASWDRLLDHSALRGVRRVIDTIDLLTLNTKMWRALAAVLPKTPIRACDVPDEVLDVTFFDKLGLAPDPQEYTIYDRYDDVIAISRGEAAEISKATSRAAVAYVPMTMEPCSTDNGYDGPAVLPTGPNPFNVQGYLFFARHVLPRIRAAVPQFRLRVSGDACRKVVAEQGVELIGFVPKLSDLYASSGFMVNPIFGGTGQQVKVIEAMAHGLPVVCLRKTAGKSPVRHGVNGLVADTAAEFADHVVQLWLDRGLRRRLGEAARATVVAEFSHDVLIRQLAALVNRNGQSQGSASSGSSPVRGSVVQ